MNKWLQNVNKDLPSFIQEIYTETASFEKMGETRDLP